MFGGPGMIRWSWKGDGKEMEKKWKRNRNGDEEVQGSNFRKNNGDPHQEFSEMNMTMTRVARQRHQIHHSSHELGDGSDGDREWMLKS
jgi:hypothetical protein